MDRDREDIDDINEENNSSQTLYSEVVVDDEEAMLKEEHCAEELDGKLTAFKVRVVTSENEAA